MHKQSMPPDSAAVRKQRDPKRTLLSRRAALELVRRGGVVPYVLCPNYWHLAPNENCTVCLMPQSFHVRPPVRSAL